VSHEVRFDPAADDDLAGIFSYVFAQTGGVDVAERYVRRIVLYCEGLTHFPERGLVRDWLRPGLRTIGFEGRVTIAFVVQERRVTILRILSAGRDVGAILRPKP
jgi:plasmid stabilization system protein ParE